jgi:hypothetical protein
VTDPHRIARRAALRRLYLNMLAFERQRYVVPPRMLAIMVQS